MSVVAWDGKRIAADKMALSAGLCMTTSKIRRSARTGEILAWTGQHDKGLVLAAWFDEGADPAKYPAFQTTDDWCRLIVASEAGVFSYETQCVPLSFENAFQAWGSGRDYALGAMAMGADAIQAVEIASRLCEGCGNGVECFALTAHLEVAA